MPPAAELAFGTVRCRAVRSRCACSCDVINLGLYSTNISYRDMQFDRSSSNPENILDNRPNIGNFNSMETWNYPKGGSDQYVTTSVGNNATARRRIWLTLTRR